jgi:hypothetical protein
MLDLLRRRQRSDASSRVGLVMLSVCIASWSLPLSAQTAQPRLSQAEHTAYQNAMSQSAPTDKAAALEAYLADYPNTPAKIDVLKQLAAVYSTIGSEALDKKDVATAITAFKKELALVSLDSTEISSSALHDTFQLGAAYFQTTPTPDYVDCAFYAARAAAYASGSDKTKFTKLADYCYKKQHGSLTDSDAAYAVAKANPNPPPSFTIKAAPTPADIVAELIRTTPTCCGLGGPREWDKEYMLRYGNPEDAATVWATVKDKPVEIPDAIVIESSPTVLKVAVSDDAVQAKIADFVFNLKESSSYIPAVGAKVTLDGTYDSFSAKPFLITMRDGVVLSATTNKTIPRQH